MAEVKMAFPDLRNPFAQQELEPGLGATVLYAERELKLASVLAEPGLWVSPADFNRINDFVVKPEGACLGELCIPLRAEWLKTVAGAQWIDIAAFAELLEQPYVVDAASNTWSFGDIPLTRQGMIDGAQAPDFELLDRAGKVV
ncbi:MAG: hypothetical protein ACI9WS_003408, partial [Paraglaciecola psychrophila]